MKLPEKQNALIIGNIINIHTIKDGIKLMKHKGYSTIAKLFHWGFVALFVYGIAKQVDDISQLEDFALLRFELIFATIFLTMLALRFLYMSRAQSSSLPTETSTLQKLAAKLAHLGMYASLAAIAITGILISVFYWIGIKNGLFVQGLVTLHESAVTLSYWLIGLHVVAAIYHRFKGDGVWDSMVPVWKEKRQ